MPTPKKTAVSAPASREDVARKIKLASAPAWRPDPGTTLYSVSVLGIKVGESTYGKYPILVVETETGEYLAMHAFHTLFRTRLAEIRPMPGTVVESITYVGYDETNKSKRDFEAGTIKETDRTFYHNYLITMPGESEEFAWDDAPE